MEDFLRSLGTTAATAAADMIPTAIDMYLREQDMATLLAGDVIISAQGDKIAFLLGRSKRGDSSKAGRDQGVDSTNPWVVNIVKRRLRGLRPGDRLFPISSAAYRSLYRKAAQHVLGDPDAIGPPHSCRHTGASRDLATGRRDFASIQRRGRWKTQESVQRYAKTHAWLHAVERQPKHVRELGARLLAQRAPDRQVSGARVDVPAVAGGLRG